MTSGVPDGMKNWWCYYCAILDLQKSWWCCLGYIYTKLAKYWWCYSNSTPSTTSSGAPVDYPKKTGPWKGHSSVIFPSWKPEGISKNDSNTICLT